MKKLSEPVKVRYDVATDDPNFVVADTRSSPKNGYIVPAALWQRAQKALSALKKVKKGRGR